ncbi:MAG: tripartite tricarboxylate transporter permease [Candidatus Methanomethylophilus sp.]|nr:tripartite tricarboxylate transporter permease [Methanomethylophilus sp.]MDD3232940.1 tripartite tricarboxylate transporter permease [Methanomethylophilus sp.]MDD4221565.1 tripartite tricarboxylate transporter permease [Methanomethylophilus sp.]MDD4668732.1 tripartite tricarboxylate transporter permease [Methanomethylophilus sp.]
MGPELLLLVLTAAAVGAAVGTFTGLVPGIHVNTLAAVLFTSYPAVETALAGRIGTDAVPLLVSCGIMSAAAVHSFVDFVPSVFVGAPDADEALSVLPGHRLLTEGRGMAAVRAAAAGSAVGAACALLLAVPVQWMMLHGLAGIMDSLTPFVLVGTLGIMLIAEDRRLLTLVVMLVAGFLGFAVMDAGIPAAGVLGESTLLFPLLTGLFGLPPLLERKTQTALPPQTDDGCDPVGPGPGLRGVLTGLLAGWYPGITATVGASLASAFGRERDPARFISLTASIGTVTAVFAVVTLSVSGSGRSGTALIVKEILGEELGGFCSETFVLLLFSIAAASALGYAATIGTGRLMVRLTDRLPAELLTNAVLTLIGVLVLLLTGIWGLAVLAVAAAVGMVPPAAGTSRVPLAACLIVPALLGQLGWDSTALSFMGWPL